MNLACAACGARFEGRAPVASSGKASCPRCGAEVSEAKLPPMRAPLDTLPVDPEALADLRRQAADSGGHRAAMASIPFELVREEPVPLQDSPDPVLLQNKARSDPNAAPVPRVEGPRFEPVPDEVVPLGQGTPRSVMKSIPFELVRPVAEATGRQGRGVLVFVALLLVAITIVGLVAWDVVGEGFRIPGLR